jgi:hypothetical protein
MLDTSSKRIDEIIIFHQWGKDFALSVAVAEVL